MATSSVSVSTVLTLWLWLMAATFPTSTWATRDLMEFEHKPSMTEFFNTDATNCSPADIKIAQSAVPQPGIPRFNVQIMNLSDSLIRKIRVNCGAFASAILIDPNVFRREGAGPYCIVKNGDAIRPHESIAFSYEQKSIQPLNLASAECVP